MSEEFERSSKRTSEWSISCHFYPECSGGGLAVVAAVAMSAVHSGMKLYEIDAFIS